MVTNQFQKTEDHKRVAFKAVVAVWSEEDNPCHLAIAAPTKDGLREAWKRITGLDLIEDRVQNVLFLKEETHGR